MAFNRPSKTKEPENYEKAYEYAVFLLSLQLRTVGEVREKMMNRGYASAIIDSTLAQLIEQKYLDDERYAQVFLENLKKYKTFGFYGIKKKLMEKRLPSNIIERVLAEGLSEEEEIEIAKKYLIKQSVIANGRQEAKQSKNKNRRASFAMTVEPRCHYAAGGSREAKEKLAQKLKRCGFRGQIIVKLIF